MLAAQLPATAADQACQLEKEAARLRKQLTRLDKADASAFKELEETEADNTPATLAYRRRTRARFIEREEERTRLTGQLAKITSQQGHTTTHDTTLLNDLPTYAALLPHTPDRILTGLLDAFDIQCLYSKEDHQVTIRAVLTDSTPQAVADLLATLTPAMVDALASPSQASTPPEPGNQAGSALWHSPCHTLWLMLSQREHSPSWW